MSIELGSSQADFINTLINWISMILVVFLIFASARLSAIQEIRKERKIKVLMLTIFDEKGVCDIEQ